MHKIYICELAWILYDAWIDSLGEENSEELYKRFIDHRNSCDLCTPVDRDDNAN